MQHARRDTLIGLTAIAGFVGLLIMLFVFGELSAITRQTYPITLELDTGSGLSSSSPVTLNGVRIGEITALTNAPDPRDGVVANIELLEGSRVPVDFEVFVDASLLGQASLDMRVRPDAGDAFVEPNETYRRTSNSLLASVRSELAAPVERVATAADRVAQLAETFDRVGTHVEVLLEPRSPADVDTGSMTANLATAIARLDETLAGASAWTNDTDTRSRVLALLDRADKIADQADTLTVAGVRSLEGIDGTRERLERDVSTALVELRAESEATLARIGAAADEIRAVGAAVNTGSGTAARLLNDPQLYDNLTAATRQLQSAVTSLELLIEKFQNEGVPIQL